MTKQDVVWKDGLFTLSYSLIFAWTTFFVQFVSVVRRNGVASDILHWAEIKMSCSKLQILKSSLWIIDVDAVHFVCSSMQVVWNTGFYLFFVLSQLERIFFRMET